jgi:AcrR family transcriptional regulator
LGSIVYHFRSTDVLMTEAVIEGLDRWLEDISERLARLADVDPAARILHAMQAVDASRLRHRGLVRSFVASLARAQHDRQVRKRLAEGFAKTRPAIAALLGLGDDRAALDAAGLLHSMFVGLMVQVSLDRSLAIEGARMEQAQVTLRGALPRTARSRSST